MCTRRFGTALVKLSFTFVIFSQIMLFQALAKHRVDLSASTPAIMATSEALASEPASENHDELTDGIDDLDTLLTKFSFLHYSSFQPYLFALPDLINSWISRLETKPPRA